MSTEKNTVQYIDLTPSWSGILPVLIMAVEEHTTGYSAAVAELKRLAYIADEYITLTKALNVDSLSNIIREVDGNHNLGAGELAEKILAKLVVKP